MPTRNHPRKLLVEGDTDQRVIPYLMEANGVPWPAPPDSPVSLEALGGVDELLKPGVLEAELSASGLEGLGVVIDLHSRMHTREKRRSARGSRGRTRRAFDCTKP